MTLMLGHKSLWRETEEKPLISLEYYSFRDKQVRGGGWGGEKRSDLLLLQQQQLLLLLLLLLFLIKRYSLTRVKLIVLYKQLTTKDTLAYI